MVAFGRDEVTRWEWPAGPLPPAKFALEALLLLHKPLAVSGLLAARRDGFGSLDWIAIAACATSASCVRAIRGQELTAIQLPAGRATEFIAGYSALITFVPEYDHQIGEFDGYSVCAAVWGEFGAGEVEWDSSALHRGPIEAIDELLDSSTAEFHASLLETCSR